MAWELDPFDVQAIEELLVPPILVRRLTDHHGRSGAHQPVGGGERECRWSESAGYHGIEGMIGSERGRVLTHHVDSVLPPEASNHSFEEVRSLGSAIQQSEMHARSIMSDDQAWHATTRTQVEDRCDGLELVECPDEAAGMSDHRRNRAGSEEAESL